MMEKDLGEEIKMEGRHVWTVCLNPTFGIFNWKNLLYLIDCIETALAKMKGVILVR